MFIRGESRGSQCTTASSQPAGCSYVGQSGFERTPILKGSSSQEALLCSRRRGSHRQAKKFCQFFLVCIFHCARPGRSPQESCNRQANSSRFCPWTTMGPHNTEDQWQAEMILFKTWSVEAISALQAMTRRMTYCRVSLGTTTFMKSKSKISCSKPNTQRDGQ
jgi:transposase